MKNCFVPKFSYLYLSSSSNDLKIDHQLLLQMETYSNRVANFFLGRGYAKGDTVALFMENRPEVININ